MDRGLGDSISKVADVVARLIGLEDCNCENRKQYLNELFPYSNTVRKFKVEKVFVHNRKRYEKDTIISVTKNDSVHQAVIAFVASRSLTEI